mgnify:CR=1 FL=1
MIATLVTSLLASTETLSPYQRWQALRRIGQMPTPRLVWVGVIAVITLVSAGCLAYWLWRQVTESRRGRRALQQAAVRAGLSEAERETLFRVAELAELKQPDSVTSMPEAFDRGVEAMINQTDAAAFNQAHGRPPEAVVAALREKLGLKRGSNFRTPARNLLDGFGKGTEVQVSRTREPANFPALVAGAGDDPLAFWLEPDVPAHCHPEEVWSIRRTEEGLLWEFSATVLRRSGNRVLLRVLSDARYINRRRFPRVPTRQKALMGELSLFSEAKGLTGPEMTAATVIDLGGPGMLLESRLRIREGRKVFLVAEAGDGQVLRAFGTVVRSIYRSGRWRTAVELSGLSPAEVSQLVRQTNRQALRLQQQKLARHLSQARQREGAAQPTAPKEEVGI